MALWAGFQEMSTGVDKATQFTCEQVKGNPHTTEICVWFQILPLTASSLEFKIRSYLDLASSKMRR